MGGLSVGGNTNLLSKFGSQNCCWPASEEEYEEEEEGENGNVESVVCWARSQRQVAFSRFNVPVILFWVVYVFFVGK
jgi:hypothetical protein